MNTKLKVILTGAAVAGLLFAAVPATAAEPKASELISPANSYLATPEELKAVGLDQSAIDAQQASWDKLTPAQRTKQNQLRNEQEGAHQDLSSVPVHHLGGQPGMVTPMTVYPQPCADAPNGYKLGRGVNIPSQTFTCYTGSGLFDWGANEVSQILSIRPGLYKGRVLYHYFHNSNYYWSVDRGPNDFNTYYFDQTYGTVYVKTVQLY